MKCPHCGRPNSLPEEEPLAVKYCGSCGQVLYELDYTRRDVRVSRGFRESFRVIREELEILRRFYLKFNKEHLEDSGDSATIPEKSAESLIPGELLDRIYANIENFKNENLVSDSETSRSALDMLSFVESYLDQVNEVGRLIDGSHALGEIREAARLALEKLKQANSFLRMMGNYLGE